MLGRQPLASGPLATEPTGGMVVPEVLALADYSGPMYVATLYETDEFVAADYSGPMYVAIRARSNPPGRGWP